MQRDNINKTWIARQLQHRTNMVVTQKMENTQISLQIVFVWNKSLKMTKT